MLADPLYTGLRQKRIRGEDYDAFIEEFMVAVEKLFPGVLVQFEDFGNSNAFRLLEKYRDRACTFNDDIQGTGAVALAGIFPRCASPAGSWPTSACCFSARARPAWASRKTSSPVLIEEGLPLAEARKRCWFVDSKGLIVKGREHFPNTNCTTPTTTRRAPICLVPSNHQADHAHRRVRPAEDIHRRNR